MAHHRPLVRTMQRQLGVLWSAAPGLLLLSALLPLALAGIPLVQVQVTRAMVDAAANAITLGPAYLGPAYKMLAVQLVMAVTAGSLRMIRQAVDFRLRQRVQFHVEQVITDKATRLPLTFFDTAESFDQLQRASFGTRGLSLVSNGLDILQSLITLTGFLALLGTVHWALSTGLLGLVLPIFLINRRIGMRRYDQGLRQTPASRRASYFTNLLRQREPAKEIRLFGLSSYLKGLWSGLYWQTANEQWRLQRQTVAAYLGVEGLSATVSAVASGALVWLGAGGSLSLGGYVALVQALVTAQNLVYSISTHLGHIYEEALFAGELHSFLDIPNEETRTGTLPFPVPLTQGIEVERLSFRYPGSQQPVLEDLSFSIAAGERVAIVGDNGAGKSTLIKCLLGLYLPSEGSVRYDGTDIRYISPEGLRQELSAVFQDFVRYQMTIRENVGFGQIESMHDDQALQAAAGKGGIDTLVDGLPQGLETLLGPAFAGGRDLSQGQWQKVALSRAFLRRAQVIALDEPTAALSPDAEVAIFQRFAQLSEGKTALLVSHRMASCRHADRILVLKSGRLVEQGTHQQLIASDGEYARMVRLQESLSS